MCLGFVGRSFAFSILESCLVNVSLPYIVENGGRTQPDDFQPKIAPPSIALSARVLHTCLPAVSIFTICINKDKKVGAAIP
jgi:hypothetical protein